MENDVFVLVVDKVFDGELPEIQLTADSDAFTGRDGNHTSYRNTYKDSLDKVLTLAQARLTDEELSWAKEWLAWLVPHAKNK